MTLTELKHEVTLLGFDAEADVEAHIIAAANRALRHLYSQRSFTKTVRLFARGAFVSYYRKEIHCGTQQVIICPAIGQAFSMRLCGSGTYTITDGTVVRSQQFESGAESVLVRGFLTKGGTIKFWGGYSFTVYDYTIYEDIFSPHIKDIPMGGTTVTFDLREMYGDFMAFISPAKDPSGNPIPGCVLTDGRIEITAGYRGEIVLTYRRLPETVTAETENIDLPEEYTHLFPLLVASYVWLDTDENKALYYKLRYDEMIGLIKTENYQYIDNSYKNENGWA